MPGSRYGARPVTGTGQLSVPDQNRDGALRYDCACAVVTVWTGPVCVVARTAPTASNSPAHPPKASLDRFTVPPRSLFVTARIPYDGPARSAVGLAEPGKIVLRITVHSSGI